MKTPLALAILVMSYMQDSAAGDPGDVLRLGHAGLGAVKTRLALASLVMS